MKYGAIDIGTNAARLLIGEISKNDEGYVFVKKISYTRVPLRLGMDVFERGKIGEKKKQDFIKTIKAFQLISEVFNVREMRACATSAMREAENSDSVKKAILKQTGVDIEIIDGHEESELVFSVFFLMELEKNMPFLVIDVGGGSTEITIFKEGKITAAKSFKIGTIRLLKNKVTEEIWTEMFEWLSSNTNAKHKIKVFGIGGNINKVNKLLGKRDFENMSFKEIDLLYEELKPLSVEKRISRYQLKADRADVIVPAMDIYLRIMKKIDAKKIIAPKIGLSDGIIYSLHNNHLKSLSKKTKLSSDNG
ncbi:exopolyphosphatase [Putridiphycobacter roseus]|uniref:Exopolyphosphatase n=1 Tax=Putridiphycobacter roseus TaxID=2219161 RepID=A0A2W1N385_9FLAO|nr:exopolyphosphatase [Putridiphycobacter roseus]PZE18334.1 exopolyphosphatase [Putridiphycobacter roseus]